MKDFRVVRARATLRVTSVSPVRNFSPPAITILGSDFQYAEEIIYNNIPCPEFIIANSNRILARIPDSQVGRALNSLYVVASTPVTNQDATVTMGLASPTRTIEGIDRLVQNFVLAFMTTPGSDIWEQADGGGAQSVIGKPTSRGGEGAMSGIAIAVDRTKQQILRAQAKNSKIPTTEKLLSASLASISYDEATTTLAAVVEIKNVAGDSSLVTIR